MDKRYQVFVSSTYDDLHQERQEVMHALLELDCIPSGMELFPAANEDQWTLIKKVIDDCDYYVVIVAGRYGSVGPTGISYTEAEYRHALDTRKPIIAFLHRDPDSLPAKRTERDPDLRSKLSAFRSLCETKHCKYWLTASELGSVVSRSLIQLIKTHPGIGWVRADNVPAESAATEILKLKRHVELLQEQLQQVRHAPPPGTEDLARGEDQFSLAYQLTIIDDHYERVRSSGVVEMTWNQIFYTLAPLLIDEASERSLRDALKSYANVLVLKSLAKKKEFQGKRSENFTLSQDDFQTVKVQLRALGLISKSERSRSVKNTDTYWTLTPYGDSAMTQLRAVRREERP